MGNEYGAYLRANFRMPVMAPILQPPLAVSSSAGGAPSTFAKPVSGWISDYGTFLALPTGMLLISLDYSTIFLYDGAAFFWKNKDGTS